MGGRGTIRKEAGDIPGSQERWYVVRGQFHEEFTFENLRKVCPQTFPVFTGAFLCLLDPVRK